MIVVGSVPVSHILKRRTKDTDIVATRDEFEKLLINHKGEYTNNGGFIQDDQSRYDFIFSDNWSSWIDIENYCVDYTNTIFGKIKCITPNIACIVKKSHLYRQLEFYKHITDFHVLWRYCSQGRGWLEFLEEEGLKSIYNNLCSDTKKNYPDKTPSLNKTKQEFFDDYVEKFFVHDDIHYVVKHYNKPIYEYCQNEQEVLCDKQMWLSLSHSDKILMVVEEALTIALERKLIPLFINNQEYKRYYRNAYYYAVMRICTNLCRGWFREFSQLNYPEIIKYDYTTKFNYFFDQVNLGNIKRLN